MFFSFSIDATDNIEQIHLNDEMLEIKKYRESRRDNFDSWFGNNKKLINNAEKNGTVLDFAIIGMSHLFTLLFVMTNI